MQNTAIKRKSQKVTNYNLLTAIYTNGLGKKFDLNSSELLVLIGLVNHFNDDKKIVFPSQEYLGEHLNIASRTIVRAIKGLISKNLIIKSKKKFGNVYGFTNIFFEAASMSLEQCQNDTSGSDKMTDACHEQNKVKYINNNQESKNKNFKRRDYYDKPIPETNHLSVEKTKQYLEDQKSVKLGSPLDFDYEQAKNWYKALMPELKNSFFAKAVREKFKFEF